MRAPDTARLLRQLARFYGVRTSYYDIAGRRRPASVEALLAVVRALGAPVEGLQDVAAALRERRQALWQQPLPPVAVAWDGKLTMKVRLPASVADAPLIGCLTQENGEQHRWQWCGADLPALGATEVEGTRYVAKGISVPQRLPWGYHRLTLETAQGPAETLVIAAPLKAYIAAEGPEGRTWGVFLPLYALHTQGSWGAGDLSALEALTEWVSEMGGTVGATLPLLATFLDEPFEPCPYVPVSRLLWNEFYLDLARVPELAKCPSALALLESSSFQEEVAALRRSPLVDYRRQMALKRQILEELSRCCFAEASERLAELQGFTKAHPVVEGYARFRAAIERRRTPWQTWPQPLRDGDLKEGDYDEETKRYHLYVQWLAHEQMEALAQRARQKGQGLYLDLPLGCHPDGYDVWRWQDLFVREVSAGAPPDTFFTRGQDWGFPPLHPEMLRQQSYSYYISCLRHHLGSAGVLRIDHLMGFHRLFWVPRGLEAREGVYVRYPAEEFYAILALESHRSRSMIVGEDLGTVPPEVRPAMARHGLHGMYVTQYELVADPQRALPPVSADKVACLNTHDMPPFAAFWQGLDIQDRQEMGLLDEAGAKQELEHRQALKESLISFLQQQGWPLGFAAEPQAVLRAVLSFLGASSAPMVLINVEDLWLETRPQNVPGTGAERPNWQRKAFRSFEAFSELPQVANVLREVDQARKRAYERQ